MVFNPATQEQRFVLDHVAAIGELAATETFAAASDDLIDAVLDGIGRQAAGEWALLTRLGDTIGARWTPDGVTMPAGYRDAYQNYVAGGWGTIGVAEAHGGQGLPFVIQTAVLETLGTADLALALCPILTLGAIEALSHHGSTEQQAKYLPHLATGAWTGTMNLTESQAGSDVGALRTSAHPRGDGTYLITGSKIFISFGDHDLADNIIHLVLARTPGAPEGTRGISLFLVPKYRLAPDGTPGEHNDVRVASIEHKLGLHASPTCVLSFGDNGDCIGELIGPEGAGMRAMFTMMNNARLNVGLQGVQAAEAATQKAADYARERVQGYRGNSAVPIIEHPDVRRMLMRMKAQTQAARALVYYAAAQVDRANLGDHSARMRLGALTPLAKAHATDIGCEVGNLCIQVHGGMGYVEETGATQFFRDVRVAAIYEGTNGIQAADLVGRKLLLDQGATIQSLIDDMRSEAENSALVELINACETVTTRLLGAHDDDRLAASYPFLTMLATATCGWLMERQFRAADEPGCDPAFRATKQATALFYLQQIVPEALGLMAAAMAPAEMLYAVPAENF
ncbi:acyl-CoA dehydrogenase [Novosphingobium sp.]|uniref:acyl-CoA dehydrogenase n=1 Tax=Novosphingobium sp. TaxID=1874826 RepID=UPI00286E7843|nr:acyl-CoA dehydrogenase [Novosphingobium sp.]